MDSKTQNIYAENCPADAIREHIEKGIKEEVPEEIILSPNNIEYLMNSDLVDYIGAGGTGNELQFYWKKTDKLPALEVRVAKREDGKFILTYIKEEASAEKQEFLWEKDTNKDKKGTVVVSKKTDALENVADMDER